MVHVERPVAAVVLLSRFLRYPGALFISVITPRRYVAELWVSRGGSGLWLFVCGCGSVAEVVTVWVAVTVSRSPQHYSHCRSRIWKRVWCGGSLCRCGR